MQCFQCGECCRTLFDGMILTSQELSLIRKRTGAKLKARKVRENRFQVFCSCPFLTKHNECQIYEIRPCQCRLYHCGRLKASDKRLETISEIKALMAKNLEYRIFRKRMEAEAVEWGNKHGWSWRKMSNADNMVFPK